jgi:hypothetical protein
MPFFRQPTPAPVQAQVPIQPAIVAPVPAPVPLPAPVLAPVAIQAPVPIMPAALIQEIQNPWQRLRRQLRARNFMRNQPILTAVSFGIHVNCITRILQHNNNNRTDIPYNQFTQLSPEIKEVLIRSKVDYDNDLVLRKPVTEQIF